MKILNFYCLILSITISFINSINKTIDDVQKLTEINLISKDRFNKSDNKILLEENSRIKFNCQHVINGCSLLFNDLNLTENHILEVNVKMRNNELFNDLSNGLSIWYYLLLIIRFLNEFVELPKEKYDFLGYSNKFIGNLLRITDKDSKIVLYENFGEEVSKTTVYYEKSLNQSENKAKNIKFCDFPKTENILKIKIHFYKSSMIFYVFSKNSFKFCFSTNNYQGIKLAITANLEKESNNYEIEKLILSNFTSNSNLIPNNHTITTLYHKNNNPSDNINYLSQLPSKLSIISTLLQEDDLNSDEDMLNNATQVSLQKLEVEKNKLKNFKQEFEKYSNLSYNDDNTESIEIKEATSQHIENLKNISNEIKINLNYNNPQTNNDTDLKKILFDTIDNILNTHKLINNSLISIENSIISTLTKINKKSEKSKSHDFYHKIIFLLILCVLVYLIFILRKLTEKTIKKVIDQDKIFDSIV